MPLFLLIFGALLIDAGMHKQAGAFFTQLKTDMVGFVAFGAVVAILGGLGSIQTIRPVTKGLLFLVFIAYFLQNGKAIASNTQNAATAPASAPQTPASGLDTSNSFSSGAGSNGNSIFNGGTNTGSNSILGSGESFSSLAGNLSNFSDLFQE